MKATSDEDEKGWAFVNETRARGREMGVPECCIEFYVWEWWPLWLRIVREGDTEAYEIAKARNAKADHFKAGYVLCDNCLKEGRVVKVNS